MATIAIRIAVTTCPRPRSLSAPKADIGATGCSTITPYKIKSQSVSVRRNCGAPLDAGTATASLLKRFSVSATCQRRRRCSQAQRPASNSSAHRDSSLFAIPLPHPANVPESPPLPAAQTPVHPCPAQSTNRSPLPAPRSRDSSPPASPLPILSLLLTPASLPRPPHQRERM